MIGTHVIYTDEFGKDHDALVTSSFGGDFPPEQHAINLVYISDEEKETDPYGRQLKRQSSVVPKANQPAHGRYWRFP